jgi:hypothetical protein
LIRERSCERLLHLETPPLPHSLARRLSRLFPSQEHGSASWPWSGRRCRMWQTFRGAAVYLLTKVRRGLVL